MYKNFWERNICHEGRNFKKANYTFLSDLKKKNTTTKTDKQTDIKTQKKKSFTIYYEHRTMYAKCCFFLICLYERQVKNQCHTPFSLSSFPYDDKI